MPDKVLCFDVDLAGVVLCHPPTYVNKVLLGARDGRLELWNVRSGKRVHAYASIARGPGIEHVAASGGVEVLTDAHKLSSTNALLLQGSAEPPAAQRAPLGPPTSVREAWARLRDDPARRRRPLRDAAGAGARRRPSLAARIRGGAALLWSGPDPRRGPTPAGARHSPTTCSRAGWCRGATGEAHVDWSATREAWRRKEQEMIERHDEFVYYDARRSQNRCCKFFSVSASASRPAARPPSRPPRRPPRRRSDRPGRKSRVRNSRH